jgi:chemotaxis protein methyltransferase CheR
MLSYEITKTEFEKIAQFIYDQVGIHLAEHKINLVRGRLSKRLRYFGFNTFTEYYEYLLDDDTGEELLMLTNEISTNVTSFFREPSQWEYLEKELKNIEINSKTKKIRVWSAACSSGQEPYTIAMFLLSNLKSPSSWDIKILATDISEEILLKAASGVYSQEDVKGLPKNMIAKYFDKVKKPFKDGFTFEYKIKSLIREMITFRKFNLVHSSYSFIKPHTFDLLFCRNVMIYFDVTTKNKVVLNLVDKVKKDGHFFIGHSESLVTMNKNDIKMQAPSIYKKIQ